MNLNAPTPMIAETRPSERQLALEYLAQIWGMADDEGVSPETMAHASIFAALATLIKQFGENVTADLIADLPERIRAGEFNLYTHHQ